EASLRQSAKAADDRTATVIINDDKAVARRWSKAKRYLQEDIGEGDRPINIELAIAAAWSGPIYLHLEKSGRAEREIATSQNARTINKAGTNCPSRATWRVEGPDGAGAANGPLIQENRTVRLIAVND